MTIWLKLTLELLEALFQFPHRNKEGSHRENHEWQRFLLVPFKKCLGALSGPLLSVSGSELNTTQCTSILRREPASVQNRPPATDLNIIAMSTKTQEPQRFAIT